jgi:K+ transporter
MVASMVNSLVQTTKSSLAALTLSAIGVVYGDIGTSVLYAMKEVFGSGHVPFTPDNIYGILSIFFWTLTVIVSIKYVVLILRADNHGEGGLVAMLALASQAVKDQPKFAQRSTHCRYFWHLLVLWRWCHHACNFCAGRDGGLGGHIADL